MKANIYNQAEQKGIFLYASCSGITIKEHEKLMNGTTKANGSKIRKLIKKHLPDLAEDLGLNFYNPYESQSRKKDGLFIYVHSAIEYFLKLN